MSNVLGSVTLAGRLESVRDARRFGRKVLEGYSSDAGRVDDLVLAISEAVTNSVVHSASRDGGEVVLALVAADGGRVRVEVTDAGGGAGPTACRPGETATSGRGVAMVEHLAHRAGTRHERDGRRTYWFEL